jgi:hypothetical protein
MIIKKNTILLIIFYFQFNVQMTICCAEMWLIYYSSQLIFENRYERHAILAHELQRPLRLTVGHACAGKEAKWRYGSNPFATTVGGQHHSLAALPTRKGQVHILEEAAWASSSIWTDTEIFALRGTQTSKHAARRKLHIYIYIYIYMCVCVYVRACVRVHKINFSSILSVLSSVCYGNAPVNTKNVFPSITMCNTYLMKLLYTISATHKKFPLLPAA